jgi:hypothetical protein
VHPLKIAADKAKSRIERLMATSLIGYIIEVTTFVRLFLRDAQTIEQQIFCHRIVKLHYLKLTK